MYLFQSLCVVYSITGSTQVWQV